MSMLHKKYKAQIIPKFRAVSPLCYFGNLLERVVLKYLSDFLRDNESRKTVWYKDRRFHGLLLLYFSKS